MPVNALGGSAFEKLQNYKEPTIQRVTKTKQPRIDEVTLKHEEAIEQSSALDTLSKLVRNFTEITSVLRRPYDNPFESKNATLTTTDLGLAEKYVSVIPGKYTPKMTFDLHVEQVATASKLLINYPINSDKEVDFEGLLDFDINGTSVKIDFTTEETGKEIVKKINSEFEKEGVKATANLLKLGDGKANIQVTNQELGQKDIRCLLTETGYLDLIGHFIPYERNNQFGCTLGTSAKIVIDGTELENPDSNIFDGKTIGFEGVTIKALAPNTVGNPNAIKQTVTIAPDTTNDGVMMKSISKFARAYNDLKIFVAKMTEKSSDKEYAKTAILHNSSAIRQAQALLDSVFDPNINNGGKYKLLSDVGVGLVPADKDEAAPIGTTLLQTVDETALRNALENNYEDFVTLFRGTLKVTETNTRGSKLALSSTTETLDSKFYNKDMNVKIKPGVNPGEVLPFSTQAIDDNGNPIFDPDPTGGGALAIARMIYWDVEVEIDGITNLNPLNVHIPIRGHYTRSGADSKFGYIDFKDTELKGLRLQWDAANVTNQGNNNPEIFTVNLSQGLADLTYFRSNDLMSADGNTGTLNFASKEIQSKVKNFSDEKTKLETILARDLEKIEQEFAKIEQMSILNDIFLDAISDILNPAAA
jgi:flagellar capping protein FliD